MLKFNDSIILNWLDLKKEFSPWTAYENLEAFEQFAKVHCKPLAHKLSDGTKEYRATYLIKKFWMELLTKEIQLENSPAELSSLSAYFMEIVKKAWPNHDDPKGQEGRLKKEIADAEVINKLQFILKESGLPHTLQSFQVALKLLAMCELAEENVYSQNFQRWESAENEVAVTSTEEQSKFQGKQSECVANQQKSEAIKKDIRLFPESSVVSLKTRATPYCFWYYSKKELERGQKIKTVRVEAVYGGNQFEKVCLELYDFSTSELIQTIYLSNGEYRDCNVAGGQIIKFLPTLAVSENVCLMREDCSLSQIKVIPKGAEMWQLGLEEEASHKVTSFAVGDESDQGILLIYGGKLMISFYKPCKEFAVKVALRMITEVLVEVYIGRKGYRLLTENGTVISNEPEWNGKSHMLTLSENGRGLLPRIEGEKEVQEVVVDETHTVLAYRFKNGKCKTINLEKEEYRIELQKGDKQKVIQIR